MSELEEQRELLYVIRSLEVLMNSGVGLEAAIHSIGKGGYGTISKDFSKILKNVEKGKRLEDELRRVMNAAKAAGYRRLMSTLYNNVTSNTEILSSLSTQAEREENERNESLKKYIEDLGGLPESLLSIGMISPIILGLLGLAPQLMGDSGGLFTVPPNSLVMTVMNAGLIFTIVIMAAIGWKAHSKDPGM